MKGRSKLIQETPRLLNLFHDAHYDAGFILIDRDDTPCVTAVLDEFDDGSRKEARKPIDQRYLFICVAVRELEAWFLADQAAIVAVLHKVSYNAPIETGNQSAERPIVELWRQQHGQVAFNKIDFAKNLAPKFKPDEAAQHSKSFTYFWDRIGTCVRSG